MQRDVEPLLALDSSGNPIDGLAPVFLKYADASGTDRAQPAITGLGGGSGMYSLEPSAADVEARTVYVVDLDPGGTGGVRADLRYWVGQVTPRYAPIAAIMLEDPAGGLWAGAAPTIGEYRNAGGPVTPQAELRAIVAPWLYALVPSNADRIAGVSYRIDAPGTTTPFWEGSFGPDPAPTVPDPIGTLLTFIEDRGPYSVNSSPLDVIVDMNAFRGPPRVVRTEVPAQAVFVDNLAGQPPHPWLGTGTNWRRYMLQVVVRSAEADRDGGEELARRIMWAIQAPQSPPAGWLTCLCQAAAPELFDEDSQRLFYFRFAVELWHDG